MTVGPRTSRGALGPRAQGRTYHPQPLALALLLTGAGACTGDNPNYVADGGSCVAGERSCLQTLAGQVVPIVCGLIDSGALITQQERCPPSALCRDGLCTAPASATSCASQGDCQAGEVCTPVLTAAAPRQVTSVCLAAGGGAKAPGDACTSDEECQSYLCLQHSRGRYCLRTCEGSGDCRIPAQCRSFDVTVTGVRGTINSCSSN